MALYNRISREELRKKIQKTTEPHTTLSFYQYYQLGNPVLFRHHLYTNWEPLGVIGRVYVSYEGINAQISLPEKNVEAFKQTLKEISFLNGIRLNWAIEQKGPAFIKLDIKVRNKIVADGLNDKTFDVTKKGQHLNAEAFNLLTAKEDAIVVDMRNHYESEVGHFKDAWLPQVATFRELLPDVENYLQDHKDKHIVMYCTGGIRCEKASAWFKHRGFEKVYQLEGGIIEYARQVADKNLDNKFVGKNFVFDERLGERITEDVIAECHQCGKPCDAHKNCANTYCHLLFIQCDECAAKLNNTCSTKCYEFNQLSETEKKEQSGSIEFNGSKFSKARFVNTLGNLRIN
jgi:UPF0176 protein